MAFNLLKNVYPAYRFKVVFLNVLNNMLVPFFNVLISAFIVRFLSLSFWGEYSRSILFTAVLTQFSLWGNKDYLLREFSKRPASVVAIWSESNNSRIPVIIVAGLLLFFLMPFAIACLMFAILLTRTYYLSYDPLITYSRRFHVKTLAEISGTIVLIALLFTYGTSLTIIRFVSFTLIAELVKLAIVFNLLNKSYPLRFALKLNKTYLLASGGFLFLSFSGFIIYKTDQLFAATFFPADIFATYQLLLSFLLVLHAFAGYIIQPFLKILYRSKIGMVKKISLRLLLNGTWICTSGLLIIRMVLHTLYKIDIDTTVLVAALFFVVPPFYYAPYLYYSFTSEKQLVVALINISGAVATFALCWGINRLVNMNLAWVLTSAAISQWMMLAAFVLINKEKTKPATQVSPGRI